MKLSVFIPSACTNYPAIYTSTRAKLHPCSLTRIKRIAFEASGSLGHSQLATLSASEFLNRLFTALSVRNTMKIKCAGRRAIVFSSRALQSRPDLSVPKMSRPNGLCEPKFKILALIGLILCLWKLKNTGKIGDT